MKPLCYKLLRKCTWNHGPAKSILSFWTFKPLDFVCVLIYFLSVFEDEMRTIWMKFPLLDIYFIQGELRQKKSKWIIGGHVGHAEQQAWKRVHVFRLRLMLSTGPYCSPKLELISSTILVTKGTKTFQKGNYSSPVLFKLALWAQSSDCEHSQGFTAAKKKKSCLPWGYLSRKRNVSQC